MGYSNILRTFLVRLNKISSCGDTNHVNQPFFLNPLTSFYKFIKNCTSCIRYIFKKTILLIPFNRQTNFSNQNENFSKTRFEGLVYPHYDRLNHPSKGTLLYKIIPSHYFFDMFEKNYLYFNRVDMYKDDTRDADLTDQDKIISQKSKFQHNPEYSLYNYYNSCREKTYACCFSTVNSDYIWLNYSGNDPNAICLVFNYEKMEQYLSESFCNTRIRYQGKTLKNFFFLNVGLVEYGDLNNDILVKPYYPNPVEYAYFKNSKFSSENEFRILLSTIGFEKFLLPNGETFDFPKSIYFDFNFNAACTKGIIEAILISPNSEMGFKEKLSKFLNKNS